MKKWILRIAVVAVVVLLAALVGAVLSIGRAIRFGVETYGPKIAKVEVHLAGADVSFLSPGISLKGLSVGNPAGCRTPLAIAAGEVRVRFRAASAFSDILIVDSITVQSPVITVEGGVRDNNLTRIEKNVNDYLAGSGGGSNGASPSSGQSKQGRKMTVKDLVITGGQLQVNNILSADKTVTIPLPDIHLSQLGTGPDGITSAEVAEKALHAVISSTATAIAGSVGHLGKEGIGGAEKAVKSVKSLFGH